MRGEYLFKLFGILLYRRVAALLCISYSLIHLHHDVVINIYFILWGIVYYHFILFLTFLQLWPLRDLSYWFLYSPDKTSIFGAWENSYFLSLMCPRFILYIPSSRISHFSKDRYFILLENEIRNQDLDTKYVHCYWDVMFEVFLWI